MKKFIAVTAGVIVLFVAGYCTPKNNVNTSFYKSYRQSRIKPETMANIRIIATCHHHAHIILGPICWSVAFFLLNTLVEPTSFPDRISPNMFSARSAKCRFVEFALCNDLRNPIDKMATNKWETFKNCC